MNIIRKIKSLIFPKKQSGVYKNSTTKYAMNSSCTLKLSSDTEHKKAKINEELKEIVKKYIDTPENLIQYIRAQGGKVYKLKNADKILSFIGEEEGFLTPLKGIKALYLRYFLGLKLKFSTKAIFVFSTDNTEIYTIARALYKYSGYKNNLPGYDYKSQELFKKVYNNKRKLIKIRRFSVKDMYACKEAIARDLESINFTIQLSNEYEQAKKALKKIKTEKSAKV